MSDLVGNPEDRFSHNEAHKELAMEALLSIGVFCMQALQSLDLMPGTNCHFLQWKLGRENISTL